MKTSVLRVFKDPLPVSTAITKAELVVSE